MAAQSRNARLHAQGGLKTAVLHRHATIFERRAADVADAPRARAHACIRPQTGAASANRCMHHSDPLLFVSVVRACCLLGVCMMARVRRPLAFLCVTAAVAIATQSKAAPPSVVFGAGIATPRGPLTTAVMIPRMVLVPAPGTGQNSTLIAACEDHQHNTIALRRSTDGGESFGTVTFPIAAKAACPRGQLYDTVFLKPTLHSVSLV